MKCFTDMILLPSHLFLSNETLHELAAYLNLVPKRQQTAEMEADEDQISSTLLVELLVRPHLTSLLCLLLVNLYCLLMCFMLPLILLLKNITAIMTFLLF